MPKIFQLQLSTQLEETVRLKNVFKFRTRSPRKTNGLLITNFLVEMSEKV